MVYSDTDEGVRSLIANHTVFAVDSIEETVRDPDVAGRWYVRFRAGRMLAAYVGPHPLAPDFQLLGRGSA